MYGTLITFLRPFWLLSSPSQGRKRLFSPGVDRNRLDREKPQGCLQYPLNVFLTCLHENSEAPPATPSGRDRHAGASRKRNLIYIVPRNLTYEAGLAGHLPAEFPHNKVFRRSYPNRFSFDIQCFALRYPPR